MIGFRSHPRRVGLQLPIPPAWTIFFDNIRCALRLENSSGCNHKFMTAPGQQRLFGNEEDIL